MAIRGKFKPRNPSKYRGDIGKITYRSSWELKLMSRLDLDDNVLWWGSEETIVRYRSPIDNKIHKYFPDFVVCVKTLDGKNEIKMLEVKPKSQSIPPIQKNQTKRKYIQEVFTWGINRAKWAAAEKYCHERGWSFEVLTEKELGIK